MNEKEINQALQNKQVQNGVSLRFRISNWTNKTFIYLNHTVVCFSETKTI